MAVTKLVNENEEYIRDAINSGVDGGAVSSTLEDVINKSDSIGSTPEQIKEVVISIVKMKKDTPEAVDENYVSEFVKVNSSKIKNAIDDGISSKEIAQTLVESTNKVNDKKSRRHLKFIINLISKLKRKELTLRKNKKNQMEKEKQNVLKKDVD